MTVKSCNRLSLGATDQDRRNLSAFFHHFNAYFAWFDSPRSAEADIGHWVRWELEQSFNKRVVSEICMPKIIEVL